MKKNFFKKLALVLALVMIATSINYVPASAAGNPAWKAKKTVVSLGNTYTYGVKNINSKYKVTYTSSKTSVGTINKISGRFTAKKAGKTNVHAIVKNGSKVVKDLVQKVTVKAPAWKNSPSTMEAGKRTAFTVSYKASGSTMKWSSSNKEAARVSSKGSVLAVAAGSTTITAKVYDKNGKRLKTLRTELTVISVNASVVSASVPATNKIAVVLSTADDKLTKESFKVTRKDNNTNVTIDSIKAEGTTVTLNLATKLINEKVYTVELNGTTAETTAKFGVPAAIKIEDQRVAPATYTKIEFTVLDAEGVDVTEEYTYEDFEYETLATVTDGKIYLGQLGDKATIKITYIGTTPVTSNEATITAAEAALGSVKAYTVTKSIDEETIGDEVDYTVKKDWISLSDTSKGYKLYVQFTDANGGIVDESRDYTGKNNENKYEYSLTSSSTGILEIDEDGYLTPYKEGTAQIKVKCGDLVDYVAVTVKPERKVSSLKVEGPSVLSRQIVNENGTKVVETGEIKATLYDQYDEKFDLDTTKDFVVEHVSGDYAAGYDGNTKFSTTNKSFTNSESDAEVTITVTPETSTDIKTLSEKLKIAYAGFTKYVTITTKQPLDSITSVSVDDISDVANSSDNDLGFTVYGLDRYGVKNYVISEDSTSIRETKLKEITYEVRDTYGDLLVKRNAKYESNGTLDGTVSSSGTGSITPGAVNIVSGTVRSVSGSALGTMPTGKGNIKVSVRLYTDGSRSKTLPNATGSFKVENEGTTGNDTTSLVPKISLKSTTVDGTEFGTLVDAFNGTSGKDKLLNIELNPAAHFLSKYKVIGFVKNHSAEGFKSKPSNSIVANDFEGTINSGDKGTCSVNIAYVVILDEYTGFYHYVPLNSTVKVTVK